MEDKKRKTGWAIRKKCPLLCRTQSDGFGRGFEALDLPHIVEWAEHVGLGIRAAIFGHVSSKVLTIRKNLVGSRQIHNFVTALINRRKV